MNNKTIQIAEHFGMSRQQSKAIEEYAEVIHVISRIQTEGVSVELREQLIEELADAEVMKGQLMFFHEITDEDIEEVKREKIERTIRRYEIDGRES